MIRQVNLLPPALKNEHKLAVVKKSLMLTLGPVLIFVVVCHFLLILGVSWLAAVAQQPTEFKEAPEISRVRQQILAVSKDVNAFFKEQKPLADFAAQQYPELNILKQLGEMTGHKVWLSGLIFDIKKGTLEFQGSSFNTRLVSEFMLGLRNLSYFSKVDLVSMGKAAQGKDKEVSFTISCQLK